MSLVLHGHAHRGRLEGRTKSGVDVFNVSMPLLSRTFTDRPAFRLFEVPAGERQACEMSPAHSTPPAVAPIGERTPMGAGVSHGRRATDAVAS